MTGGAGARAGAGGAVGGRPLGRSHGRPALSQLTGREVLSSAGTLAHADMALQEVCSVEGRDVYISHVAEELAVGGWRR